ncbi:hypothetical protein K1719_023956 [Acacia pycnantha]|nr:hypothetical protein K1719_023956 [Acacia pycnantha]
MGDVNLPSLFRLVKKQQVGEVEDDGDDSQDGHGDDEGQEGDSDGHHDNDGESGHEDEASYEDDASVGTPINIESDGESPTGEGGTNEGEQSIVPYPVQQEDAAPRSLQRPKKPKNMSPWTLTKPLKRARKAKEEKEILFDLISEPFTKDEREQILIKIDNEDITREQLQTLGRRNRLSNPNLLNRKPAGWKVSEWKQQLLPEHIGYNMGDCDLIMGPMLVAEHWFCMALDPTAMNFYVLDSMKTKVYISKNQASKKKENRVYNCKTVAFMC